MAFAFFYTSPPLGTDGMSAALIVEQPQGASFGAPGQLLVCTLSNQTSLSPRRQTHTDNIPNNPKTIFKMSIFQWDPYILQGCSFFMLGPHRHITGAITFWKCGINVATHHTITGLIMSIITLILTGHLDLQVTEFRPRFILQYRHIDNRLFCSMASDWLYSTVNVQQK